MREKRPRSPLIAAALRHIDGLKQVVKVFDEALAAETTGRGRRSEEDAPPPGEPPRRGAPVDARMMFKLRSEGSPLGVHRPGIALIKFHCPCAMKVKNVVIERASPGVVLSKIFVGPMAYEVHHAVKSGDALWVGHHGIKALPGDMMTLLFETSQPDAVVGASVRVRTRLGDWLLGQQSGTQAPVSGAMGLAQVIEETFQGPLGPDMRRRFEDIKEAVNRVDAQNDGQVYGRAPGRAKQPAEGAHPEADAPLSSSFNEDLPTEHQWARIRQILAEAARLARATSEAETRDAP